MILHENFFRYISQISWVFFLLFEDFTVIYVYELVTFCFESLETSSLGWVYFYYQSTTGLFSNEIEQWRPFTSWWYWQIYLLSTTVLEDKTGFQLWSSSSDHHGKCELTVDVYPGVLQQDIDTLTFSRPHCDRTWFQYFWATETLLWVVTRNVKGLHQLQQHNPGHVTEKEHIPILSELYLLSPPYYLSSSLFSSI